MTKERGGIEVARNKNPSVLKDPKGLVGGRMITWRGWSHQPLANLCTFFDGEFHLLPFLQRAIAPDLMAE